MDNKDNLELLEGLMLRAFNAGRKYEQGEQVSWDTYNKLTGFQKPNTELTFEQWYNEGQAYPEACDSFQSSAKDDVKDEDMTGYE